MTARAGEGIGAAVQASEGRQAEATALVSIGMPVHNGARYLQEALDSLLAQDYPHFELIISDNASTDETEAICRQYAEREARVQYHRNEENRGAVWNFNHVLDLSQGTYFMWAAFDDLRSSDYLTRTVAMMQEVPTTVLCCTGVRFIDSVGNELPEMNGTWLHNQKPIGRTREQRVRSLSDFVGWFDFYGLIRREVLVHTRRVQAVWGSDPILLLELALRGEIMALPEKLFTYRVIGKPKSQPLEAPMSSVQVDGTQANWADFTIRMADTIWGADLSMVTRLRLVIELMTGYCLRNRLMRGAIRGDLLPCARHFWSGGELLRIGQLIPMAMLVYPPGIVRAFLRRLPYGRETQS